MDERVSKDTANHALAIPGRRQPPGKTTMVVSFSRSLEGFIFAYRILRSLVSPERRQANWGSLMRFLSIGWNSEAQEIRVPFLWSTAASAGATRRKSGIPDPRVVKPASPPVPEKHSRCRTAKPVTLTVFNFVSQLHKSITHGTGALKMQCSGRSISWKYGHSGSQGSGCELDN